jgi:hypothetical protein
VKVVSPMVRGTAFRYAGSASALANQACLYTSDKYYIQSLMPFGKLVFSGRILPSSKQEFLLLHP